MKIIIEGLPEDQKIKHINVDISFDENGGVDKIESLIEDNIQEKRQAELDALDTVGVLPKTNLEVPMPPVKPPKEERESKPVPDEMKDIEF